VRALASRLAVLGEGRYALVVAGFLELAQPSIPAAVEECLTAGVGEVVVLPYFLSRGRHVAEDIPTLIAPLRAAHREVRIVLAPYLGAAEGIPDLLLNLAASVEFTGS